MWWSKLRTRFWAVLSVGILCGCGFSPVYGPGGSADGLRGTIAVDPPRDLIGFALVEQLEQRLGQPGTPAFRLAADIYFSESRLGITSGEEATRIIIQGRADFTLTGTIDGLPVTRGSVDSFTSYSTTGTPFATQTAQADARERLMVILADQIIARLLATAQDWRP